MTSYEDVPYPVYSHSQTHPAELATLATLHGLQPAPVEHCRVLEIGCASGGNIIPMAYGLPGSQFVGIDYSPRQIEQAHQFTQPLNLNNIQFHAIDLLNFDHTLGPFDYIIAHGFYSWVPAPVRAKLFEICQRNLAPQGVAYISYNAYPGWKAMSAIRDMLLYRIREIEPPLERADSARRLLEFLSEFTSSAKRLSASITYAHADYIKAVLNATKKGEEAYFLHDILEETNDPVYFTEFMAQAGQYGLQYLSDSDFRASLPSIFPDPVAQELGQMAHGRIEWEQYCDFLSNRMFRQTLLCHAGLPVNFKLTVEALRIFRFGSSAKPEVVEGEPAPDVAAVAKQKFVSSDGASITTDHPVSKAALHYLIEQWPRTVPFMELFQQARARVGAAADPSQANLASDVEVLASTLLNGFSHSDRLIAFTVYEPPFTTAISERPVASAWARQQAAFRPTVTTLRHGRFALETYEQFVIQFLDGNHDIDMITDALFNGPVAQGDLTAQKDGQPVTDPAEQRILLRETIVRTIKAFAMSPLLHA